MPGIGPQCLLPPRPRRCLCSRLCTWVPCKGDSDVLRDIWSREQGKAAARRRRGGVWGAHCGSASVGHRRELPSKPGPPSAKGAASSRSHPIFRRSSELGLNVGHRAGPAPGPRAVRTGTGTGRPRGRLSRARFEVTTMPRPWAEGRWAFRATEDGLAGPARSPHPGRPGGGLQGAQLGSSGPSGGPHSGCRGRPLSGSPRGLLAASPQGHPFPQMSLSW